MGSKDLNELRNKLFNERYEVLSISEDYDATDINPSFKASVVLEKEESKSKITIQSSEPDFAIYVSQLRNIVKTTGEEIIFKIKDTGRYYSDIEHLIDLDGIKIKKAADEIITNKLKFSYNAFKLIDEFLENKRDVEHKKFLPLKEDYYYILASACFLSEKMLKGHERLKTKYTKANDYITSIDTIMSSFLKTCNAIKDFQFYKTYINFDIEELAHRASTQLVIANDTMKDFKNRQIIDSDIAIPRMMNIYGRKLEILRPLINLIRIGLELKRGNSSPEKDCHLACNIEFLKADKEYGSLFYCLDDQIRHSDAHASIRIDKANRQVHLLDARSSKEKIVRTYTFQEIINKINIMTNEFYPAVFPTIVLFDISILDVLLTSREYKMLLLNLGNC